MTYEITSTGLVIYDNGGGGQIPIKYIYKGEEIKKSYKLVLTISKKIEGDKIITKPGMCIR